MSGVRYVGITDDVTVCDACGREDLARTVIVEWLDADGNGTGEVARYGTTCAARALGKRGVRVSGRQVVAAATVAQTRTVALAAAAADLLAHYGLPLSGGATEDAIRLAAPEYRDTHRHAAWAGSVTPEGWLARVNDMVVVRQGHIADATLLGWSAPVPA